jgi:hypothetical protein
MPEASKSVSDQEIATKSNGSFSKNAVGIADD